MAEQILEINRERYDHKNDERNLYKANPGVNEDIIREISKSKNEPEWMLEKRLKCFEIFKKLPMPAWGPSLSELDLDKISYFVRADAKKNSKSWDELPDDIKKTFERLGIPEAERKVLGGVGAQYECLTGDTKVFTNPAGPKEIKSIKPGDKVFAYDESSGEIKPSIVKGIMSKGERQIYEVKIGTKKIKTTINHPFLALVYNKKQDRERGRYSKEWRYLSDLKKGDLVAVVKQLPHIGQNYHLPRPEKATYKHNEIKIPQFTDEDFMWFLGVYLGDGFLHKEKSKARVEIAIPKQDEQLRKELVNCIQKLFNIEASEKDEFRITIYSTILARFLEQISFGGSALTKKIPEWVFSLPKIQILAFLGGYLDSDGYVRDNPKNHDVSYTSGNKRLLEDVKMLTLLCGLSPSEIQEFKSRHVIDKDRFITGYRLQVSGNTDIILSRSEKRTERFGKKKYFHNFSSAKNTTFKNHVNEHIGFAKIESIKALGIEPVYDIEVEKFHNFVAEGIIVHNSEVIYHNLRKDLEEQGIIFLDCDVALQQFPELVKKYFMTSCVSPGLHKFAALHGAVWSGGTFIYVPKGVKVTSPLQAYFRMNAEKMGQFEHTLIIVDESAEVHYIEGCSAPQYASSSLHAGCVEIHVHKNARARYSSIENWSRNTFNLNTKRAVVDENGVIEWINGNMGSRITMLYPTSVLRGKNAKSDYIGIAFAGKGQNQDTGTKVYHLAPNTTSTVKAKSISKDGGITTYRGLLKISKGAINSKSNVNCDALMMDNISKSNTVPYMEIKEEKVDIGHEASVGKISEEQVFYLMSRGLSKEQATQMIISGFIEPVVKQLPLEYAVELNRLIELEMEGSLG